MRLANRKVSEPVSILMPVCNEAEGIESVIAELAEVVFRYLPDGSEFHIDEAGSTDGTREILQELRNRWPFLEIVHNQEREGFAKAARNLYERAMCPLVFFTDSDGQCVASEFWKLAAQIDHADMVLGIKNIRYDPLPRRIASYGFNCLASWMFRMPYRDINFGFRLYRREPLIECLRQCRHMPTLINAEIQIWAQLRGFTIRQVRVHHRPRLYGMSRGLQPGSLLTESWKAFRGLVSTKRDGWDRKDN